MVDSIKLIVFVASDGLQVTVDYDQKEDGSYYLIKA